MRHFAWLLLCAALAGSPARAEQPVVSCAYNVQHTGAACEVTPVVSAATESSHVIKAVPGVLIKFQVNNWNATDKLTVMLFDLAAAPVNGTVAPIKWYGLSPAAAAGQPTTLTDTWIPGPMLHFLNGLVIACSTTGPTTLTLASDCTFSADVQ